jgi:hypothetical protein
MDQSGWPVVVERIALDLEELLHGVERKTANA